MIKYIETSTCKVTYGITNSPQYVKEKEIQKTSYGPYFAISTSLSNCTTLASVFVEILHPHLNGRICPCVIKNEQYSITAGQCTNTDRCGMCCSFHQRRKKLQIGSNFETCRHNCKPITDISGMVQLMCSLQNDTKLSIKSELTKERCGYKIRCYKIRSLRHG